MLISDKTIAAAATPRAAGGISVIRISGEEALIIADKVFTPISSEKKPSEMEGYTCAYGKIHSESGEELDDGVITIFKEPRSYTGENTAEISCHGGIFVTEKVLRAIYECGAVPAGPGEFTKRAFLNGKLSLTQAEAVMDIISAEGNAAHRRALNVKEGMLYKKIRECSEKLLKILGEIGAWIDYPEEDIPEIDGQAMESSLSEILSELEKIRKAYDNTRILKAGIDTVIAGKPNVGKSTLMNMLSGCERSIVTDIAGTTRDIVEESVRIGDIVLRLSDTAGIRETGDIIEGAGIERAVKKLSSADLIIAVFDNGEPLDSDDIRLIETCRECSAKKIACINKSDRFPALDREIIFNSFENVVEISAKNGEGADKLQKVLYNLFITDSSVGDEMSVNERQKQCLDKGISCITEALEAIGNGITLDAVNVVLDEAENVLTELTGERTTESVVNEVFSHFCVGK